MFWLETPYPNCPLRRAQLLSLGSIKAVNDIWEGKIKNGVIISMHHCSHRTSMRLWTIKLWIGGSCQELIYIEVVGIPDCRSEKNASGSGGRRKEDPGGSLF